MSEKKETGAEKNKRFVAKIEEIAMPLSESESLELVLIEYQRESSGRILRIYIDRPGGVTLDDCADFSRQLSDLLDINLESEESYSLEVSSPGIDRPLVKKADFNRFKGSIVRIRTAQPINGQKNFKGKLLGISGEDVILTAEDKNVSIAFQMIKKARIDNNS